MSLLFGEIVEPSSRAFWDDYDDYEENETVIERFVDYCLILKFHKN